MNEIPQNRGRWVMLGLFGLFAVPLIAAFVWYLHVSATGPASTTNHGEFVTPPQPVKGTPVPLALKLGTLPGDYFHGRWTLVYIGPADCDADCKEVLYATRQVRLAIGRDMERVQRLFLVHGRPLQADYLLSDHPDLTVADVSGQAGIALVRQFAGPNPPARPRKIYLVDPLGNLMMTYPSDADPEGLLADLRQLLKLSRSG